MKATELLLLCGFLGSGKTSLLVQHLAQADTRDTAVIVNEVGQIDIDGAVVAADASLPSVLLSNGCVCCSLVNDLQATIGALQADRAARGQPPFARIVLECSGLSRPGPILRSLHRLPGPAWDVRVLATFDLLHGERWLATHDEAAAQLAAAQAIVLTKTDLVGEEPRQAATALLRQLNPLAVVVDEAGPALRARRAFDPATVAAACGVVPLPQDDAPRAQLLAHRRIRTLRLDLDPALDWEHLSLWLDDLVGFCGDRLLRLKGFVQPSDSPSPVLVQSVGTLFSPPRPVPAHAGKRLGLVLITRGLSAAEIETLDPACAARVRAWSEYGAPDRLLAA
ncbi:MAG TPA: GTP-binding protein [Pseudorhodoferax sp.]|nr:GTP-binding protein [Pseudorhodoferax sp.]